MDEARAHWDEVYARKGDAEVSWFEEMPALSLALIDEAGVTPASSIIDIGGGTSRLVDALVARGQAHIAVLDISANAIDRARKRVGESKVEWIVGDVTGWEPKQLYDVWHDRAAFHFLTEEWQQSAYAERLLLALAPNGVAIFGTFAPDGPDKCSGLPVVRHDAASISGILGPAFALERHRRHDHATPWGSIQRFQFSSFRRIQRP